MKVFLKIHRSIPLNSHQTELARKKHNKAIRHSCDTLGSSTGFEDRHINLLYQQVASYSIDDVNAKVKLQFYNKIGKIGQKI